MKIFQFDSYFTEYQRITDKATPIELFALLFITLVGFALHFWGLGSTGLHGDEETMAMPVRSIVENGLPLLPSEMFYSRGLSQLYLMAASVMVFGESEWSLRLPSAVFGSLIPIVAWALSRKLLTTTWSLMFVAVITLLPETIEASQTARFYIFYFIVIMLFVRQVLCWGQSLEIKDLLLATLLFLIGLDFQALMVFSLAAFALPMCINYNSNKFRQGLLGIGLCIVAFVAHWAFTSAMYDDGSKLINTLAESEAGGNRAHDPGTQESTPAPYLLFAIFLVLALGFSLWRAVTKGIAHSLATASLLLSVVFAYSGPITASICLLAFGLIMHVRLYRSWIFPIAILLLVGALTIWQIDAVGWDIKTYFRENTQVMSLWPWIIFLGQFPVASLIVLGLAAPLVIGFMNSGRLPYGVAILLALVALPITVISLATWYPPPRYMFGFLPFFILASFLLLQYWSAAADRKYFPGGKTTVLFLGLVLSVAFIRPIDVLRTINKGCATIANYCLPIPDHRAQAEFMRSLDLKDSAIVIAEDVLQQTYYLGGVDYWLLGKDISAQFVREKNGQYLDIYTATPTILDGVAADALFGSEVRPDIYLIGNPENSYGNRADHLTNGLFEAVNHWPHQLVFSNENDSAKIWLYPANSGN